jgi:hypothetical protein
MTRFYFITWEGILPFVKSPTWWQLFKLLLIVKTSITWWDWFHCFVDLTAFLCFSDSPPPHIIMIGPGGLLFCVSDSPIHHNDWSRWFAISSVCPSCLLSLVFSFYGWGCKKKSKITKTWMWKMNVSARSHTVLVFLVNWDKISASAHLGRRHNYQINCSK